MTIRRSERDCGIDPEDNNAWLDDDDLTDGLWDPRLLGDPAFAHSIRLYDGLRALRFRDGDLLHPAVTDFGPASLAAFLRCEIDNAVAAGEAGNGKDKGPAPSLTLAKDALLHLRGLKSKDDISQPSQPAAPQMSLSTASVLHSSPLRNSVSVRQGPTSPRRILSSRNQRTDREATARSLDFAQHTQQVRNRARSEHRQVTSPRRPTTSAGVPYDHATRNGSRFFDPMLGRRRIMRTSTSALRGTSDDRHQSMAEAGRNRDACLDAASSRRLPGDEINSDLLLNDEEGNVDSLNGFFGALATDSSRESSNEDEEDITDVLYADDQLSRPTPRSGNGKRVVLDWSMHTVDEPDLSLVLPGRASHRRVKSFSYHDIVPSEKPRIIAQRINAPENTAVAPPPPAAASGRPARGFRDRRGRFPMLSDLTAPEALSEDNARSSRGGKTSSRQQVKFVVANDVTGRKWNTRSPPISKLAPPTCLADPNATPRNAAPANGNVLPISYDVWNSVVSYLSFEDLRNLRLSCKGLASEIAPLMLRSVVTTFGKSMFSLDRAQWQSNSPSVADSMLSMYGQEIHKFGISFEYDPLGLAHAAPKITEKREEAWYGSYRWPLETYPRFAELQELEDLVDNNRPLLKDSLSRLKDASELALSLDTGHGWLNGPDISDRALFESRRTRGTKVFGERFQEDTWHAFGRNELFEWAQENSVNETLKVLSKRPDSSATRRHLSDFKNMEVRSYDSFIDERSQPDFDPFAHTGGQALHPIPQHPQHQHQAVAAQNVMMTQAQIFMQHQQQVMQHQALQHFQQAALQQTQAALQQQANLQLQQAAIHQAALQPGNAPAPTPAGLAAPAATAAGGTLQRLRPGTTRQRNDDGDNPKPRPNRKIPAQWPIIFNGYNIAADVGGRDVWIQNKLASPTDFPLVPGHLTEAQVQWLMETAWAQRAFLSAYTTAVIVNKDRLSNIKALTIAKISSGLLPSLAQKEFWASLAGLKYLKILVSPDWRNEHAPGDKFFATHMVQSSVLAASKLAELLRMYISKLEKLSQLTVGYIGGGENATGMFARNQHLLPAPITEEPRGWVTDHIKKPDPATLFVFKHIKDLTFENCWFSPCMLETFMEKSQDTSLHTLVLDSVSMLSRHSTGIDGHLSTVRNGLRCQYDETDWLHEDVPGSAVWTDLIDKITPNVTLLERRYAAGMIDECLNPMPEKQFRGNIEKIEFKSCGYAKVSGVKGDEFNQNALVMQTSSAMDTGLHMRRRLFDKWSGQGSLGDDDGRNNPLGVVARPFGQANIDGSADTKKVQRDMPVMMSTNNPSTGSEWFGLGTLTQCVHPVEKRILEKAWGMKFGWGDSIERWAAVEDGWFEGGTGRFSGVVEKSQAKAD